MNRLTKSIVYPFRLFGAETQQASIWVLFTIICGLIGICMNVWSHVGPEVGLYQAIKQEFIVNSFYTYSIVLLSSTAGALFMKMDKDRLVTYKAIKIWLLILLGGFVFIGAFLCQSRGKLPCFNWYQLIYFLLTIIIAVYGFCVVNMDRHPNLFTDLEDRITQEDADEIKGLIDKMARVSQDIKGNKI